MHYLLVVCLLVFCQAFSSSAFCGEGRGLGIDGSFPSMGAVQWFTTPPEMQAPARVVMIFTSRDPGIDLVLESCNELQQKMAGQVEYIGLTYETDLEFQALERRMPKDIKVSLGRLPISVLQDWTGEADPRSVGYIIDPQGHVLWYGPPGAHLRHLSAILNGTYDREVVKRTKDLERSMVAAIRNADGEGALVFADQILVLDPYHEATYWRMNVAVVRNDLETYRAILQRVDPEKIGGFEAAGVCLYLLTQAQPRFRCPDQAERFLRRAVFAAPDHPYVLFVRSYALASVGQVDKAMPLIERAIAAAPSVTQYHDARQYYEAILSARDEWAGIAGAGAP